MAKIKKITEHPIYCAKCDLEMKLVHLPSYEFEEGLPLENAEGYKCPNCQRIFFTEQQAKLMEERTDELNEQTFGFMRKVTISGKSLVITIPLELAHHTHLHQGTKVKILPLADEGFIVRKVA